MLHRRPSRLNRSGVRRVSHYLDTEGSPVAASSTGLALHRQGSMTPTPWTCRYAPVSGTRVTTRWAALSYRRQPVALDASAETERVGMRIVVIGGSGLIGSKLVAKLGAYGFEAVAASPNS